MATDADFDEGARPIDLAMLEFAANDSLTQKEAVAETVELFLELEDEDDPLPTDRKELDRMARYYMESSLPQAMGAKSPTFNPKNMRSWTDRFYFLSVADGAVVDIFARPDKKPRKTTCFDKEFAAHNAVVTSQGKPKKLPYSKRGCG